MMSGPPRVTMTSRDRGPCQTSARASAFDVFGHRRQRDALLDRGAAADAFANAQIGVAGDEAPVVDHGLDHRQRADRLLLNQHLSRARPKRRHRRRPQLGGRGGATHAGARRADRPFDEHGEPRPPIEFVESSRARPTPAGERRPPRASERPKSCPARAATQSNAGAIVATPRLARARRQRPLLARAVGNSTSIARSLAIRSAASSQTSGWRAKGGTR